MSIYFSILISLLATITIAQSGVGVFPKFDSIHEKNIKIYTYKNSKVVIFPKEYDLGKFEDSIQFFTPTFEIVEKVLGRVERKNFKMWKENYNWFYRPNKDMDKLIKRQLREEKKYSIEEFEKIAGKPTTIIQIFGGQMEGEKYLSIQLLDFSSDPYNLQPIALKSYIDGWHGWFETNRKIIIYNLDERNVMGSWEIE
ncbi:hypothetical protein [Moheibacter lacus]|uniref:Uncharacterized protein n=1 Tax=Moheibacter lacus TaxID=2745851 RepID=A0A838ZIQ5_9FLAO|nr:hypothetical protein [Moheibacter lacus]MBA5629138.1 hypothetical protein [Moheibacter lacus]